MKANVCLCLVCACLGGCLSPRPSAPSTFFHLAGRNFHEAACQGVEDQVFKHTAHKYACAAYRGICKLAPDGSLSLHYEDGFLEGYIDYLDAGGTGEPPAMPPFRYGLHLYQTVEGRQAVRDWFAGFRHGSAVARSSGFREMILVPLASFPCEPPAVQFYLPPGGQLRDGRRQPELYSVPPTRKPDDAPDRLPPPKPVTEASRDDRPKVRLLLPEPMPIALQQGGVR